MSSDSVGQFCALMSAIAWALALIFFRKSGERIHPLALNMFKNVVGIVLLLATIVVVHTFDIRALIAASHESGSWHHAMPATNYYLLIISGVLGIAIADTLLFRCLNLVGVSMFVIVECTYSPIMLLVAWWALSERLQWPHFIGGALILFALLLSARARSPEGRTRGQVAWGFVLGILYIFLMAVGIVLAKPVFAVDGFPLLEATVLRLVAGTLALAALSMASPLRRSLFAVFRPSGFWKYSVPGAVLGGYMAMVLWLAGFKYTETAVAAILNQTSVLFAAVFAAVFLRELMTKRKSASILMALVGVLVVQFGPAMVAGWGTVKPDALPRRPGVVKPL